jgi:ADP-ribosylglycohydrolase
MPSKIVEIERDYKKDVLLGIAVGDAMGLPFEFLERDEISINSGALMIGFGSHNQAPGTFSDDSSLTFCTVESLINGYNLDEIAANFVKWKNASYWTANGDVFDIGDTTSIAIDKIANGISPLNSGDDEEFTNGNGSLMRILPLVFIIKDFAIEKRYEYTKELSGITHAHTRSIMACFYYLEFARLIIAGERKKIICSKLAIDLTTFFNQQAETRAELHHFDRILNGSFLNNYPLESIKSTGYVIDSLEAALYCFMKYNRYEMAIIQAIQLGNDTDTIAAITGGLAALYFGHHTIPEIWLMHLKRKEAILDLAKRWNEN